MKRLRFILAGPGAMGLSLAAAWVRAGHRCVGLYGRGPRNLARGRRFLNAKIIRHGREGKETRFDALLVAVPDASIAATARAWAGLSDWNGKFAFHTSGALPSTLLAALREQGARVGSLHPLTSVPRPSVDPELFTGITFALEGDPAACALGSRLVRTMGGRPLRISIQAKASYHLAACLSSGYLLAYLAMASGLIEKVGGLRRKESLRALMDLATATLGNAREMGFSNSLTGPIVRGDLVTLRLHAEVLRNAPPPVRQVHAIVAKALLGFARAGGRVQPKTARAMMAMLSPKERN
jgi:predicted short-subunit dehydrogenase-like oxidoreductase (DUF2520 family)